MADIERNPVDIEPPKAMLNGETIDITPENSHCTIHALGSVAVGDIVRSASDFDFIRIVLGQEKTHDGDVDVCAYLFRGAEDDMLFDSKGFEAAVEKLKKMGAPMNVNVQSVNDNIVDKFFGHIEKASNFGSDDLDGDLNDLIDQYRRNSDDDTKD